MTHKILYSLAISLIAMICVCFPVTYASATSVIELTDDQFVSLSSEIVHGTIQSVESFEYSDSIVLTRVTLEVKTWLKPADKADSVFIFYTRGGTVGEKSQTIPGEVVPVVGDEVVVFLERIPRYQNLPMVLGLKQGAFYAEPAVAGSKKRMIQNIQDLTIQPVMNYSRPSFKTAQTLDDLIVQIRTKLAERK